MGLPTAADHIELPATLGRYQLLAKLAAGGAAAVYLARQRGKAGFEKPVAVKVLHQHLSNDPGFVSAFLDEARLAAQIHHPNVVDIFDVDALSGKLVIVMEYIEGTALDLVIRELAAKGQAAPPGFALAIIHDALEGLHAAHELTDTDDVNLGLIHRDVSPQNILLGEDGIARLTDFGVAHAAGRATNTGNKSIIKGKLQYLAPETVENESREMDRLVDIFAMGTVLWETLTGKRLFKGSTPVEILASLLHTEITPPSQLREGVPPELDAVVLKALERVPERRFQTAREFADALEQAGGNHFYRSRQVGEYVKKFSAEATERRRMALEIRTADSSMGTAPIDSGDSLGSSDTELQTALGTPAALSLGTRKGGRSWLAPVAVGGAALVLVAVLAVSTLGGDDRSGASTTAAEASAAPKGSERSDEGPPPATSIVTAVAEAPVASASAATSASASAATSASAAAKTAPRRRTIRRKTGGNPALYDFD
jgi:serine/threonine-protein kinase